MRKVITGSSIDAQFQAADTALDRLQRMMENLKITQPQPTPFIISGAVNDSTNAIFAYLPMNCIIDNVDVFVEHIAGMSDAPPEAAGKIEAVMFIQADPVTGAGLSLTFKIKAGRTKAAPKYRTVSPTRISVTFDRPVKAWVCLVAHPMTQSEVANEGILHQDIQLGQGD